MRTNLDTAENCKWKTKTSSGYIITWVYYNSHNIPSIVNVLIIPLLRLLKYNILVQGWQTF